MSTDTDWEAFGRSNPYFGVLTDDRYRSEVLTADVKEEFFETGYAHVADVLETLGSKLGRTDGFTRALDFGCGVGRLVIPFARIATDVVGVDVSDAMLAEAGKNCRERGVTNVSLLKSDDELSTVEGEFDLVHSFIVLQHIPVSRGEKLFDKLVGKVSRGGVGALQLTYAKERTIGRRERLKTTLQNRFPLALKLKDAISGHRHSAPVMQMNCYDLNRLFCILQTHGVTTTHLEFTNHGGELGVFIFFAKP